MKAKRNRIKSETGKKTINKVPVIKNYQFKIIRSITGFTQFDVANNIEVSRVTLQRYENNKIVMFMPIWFIVSLIDLVEKNLNPNAWISVVEMYNKQFPEHIIKDYK